MANKQKKKRRYWKSSLYDRAEYYLNKAIKTNKQADYDYAIGYLDGIDGKYTKDKKLGNNDNYHRGNVRASSALGIAKNVKF